MTSKLVRCFWIVILVLLVACGEQTTQTVSVNHTAMPAALTMVAQTMTAMPTSTVIPTNTPLTPTMTLTSTSAPTSTSLPFVKLDGLRVAYTIAGNLYVQDSGEQPIQLTNSGQDRSPVFSGDGKKIVFFREWKTEMNQLHVIDADGAGERVLVSPELLIASKLGYGEANEPLSMDFVPGTHLLLFNTQQFIYPKEDDSHPTQNNDLLLVNTDTGVMKQIVEPSQGGYFLASPNGKWVAVQTPDHVDVIDLQGGFVLRSLFNHSPDEYDCVYYGYICAPMFWKQDSSELILVRPIPGYGSGPLVRTVWKYPLDGRPEKEIRLTPANPMGEALSVSPDGNWIAFSLFEQGDQDGVYLGNLHDGTSRRIYPPELSKATKVRDPSPLHYYGWSPDNRYFAFEDWYDTIIGNIQGETILIGTTDVLGWIDNSHYFSGSILGEIGSSERVRVIELHPDIDRSESPIAFVFLRH